MTSILSTIASLKNWATPSSTPGATLTVEVVETRDLGSADNSYYATLKVGVQSHSTRAQKGPNPSWKGSSYSFKLNQSVDQELTIQIYTYKDSLFHSLVGDTNVGIPLETGHHEGWLKLSKEGEIFYRMHPVVSSPTPVGVIIDAPPAAPLTTIEALERDLAALGMEEAAKGAKIIWNGFFNQNTPTDDRKGGLDDLVHLLARLPINSGISQMLESQLIEGLWNDIVKPPRVLAGDYFRSPDGSRNSLLYPDVGKSNSHYARTVTTIHPTVVSLPDPGDIFDLILDRGNREHFIPHPNNINVVLFYLATLITHDLFYSDSLDPTLNTTTHYLDLSPLYGRNKEEQWTIRTGKDGFIKNDSFTDWRFSLQPPGVPSLVVVFSRNHNYIAKTIKELNEGGRFSSVSPNGSHVDDKELDEKIFQTARLINNGCYLNIIVHEYLHAILGLPVGSSWYLDPTINPPASNPTGGNQVSIEFNFVYRWHSAIGEKDAKWAEQIIKEYLNLIKKSNGNEEREKPHSFDQIMRELSGVPESEWPLGTPIRGLHRNPKDGSFDSAALGKIFESAIEQVAGRPGANHIPTAFRFIEIGAILQGRLAGTCSLNEFRQHLKLTPYTQFNEINPDPDVFGPLSQLYRSVDDVELYVGLVAEQAKTYGLALQYTTSRGILSDAVNLIRGDRFYTDDFTPNNLTAWGYKYAKGNPVDDGGSIMHKLLLQHIPNYFPPDSEYVWDAFHVPPPGAIKPSQWPNPTNTAVSVTTFKGVTEVFKQNKVFNVIYGPKMDAITKGYGNILGWPDTEFYRRDHGNLIKVVFPEDYARIREYAHTLSSTLIKKNSRAGRGGVQTLDAVADLIRIVAPSFVAEYFGLTLSNDPKEKLLTFEEFSAYLDVVFQWLFLDLKPEDSVFLGKNAIKAAAALESFVLEIIKRRRNTIVTKPNDLLGRLLELQRNSKNQKQDGLDDDVITYNLVGVIIGASSTIILAASKSLEFFLKPENKKILENLSKEDDDQKIQKYILEALRFVNPMGPLIPRVALEDYVVKGGTGGPNPDVKVTKGQLVYNVIAQAALDPTAFPDPLEFKVDRPVDNYLTFGHDFHHCYGRRQALSVISGILGALTPKKDLRVYSPISYLTRDASLSPYPQSFVVKYTQ